MPPERLRVWLVYAVLVGAFTGAMAALFSRSPDAEEAPTLLEGRSKVELVSPLLAPPFGATAAGTWQQLTRPL